MTLLAVGMVGAAVAGLLWLRGQTGRQTASAGESAGALEWGEFPLREAHHDQQIAVQLDMRRHCDFGDADAIAMDLDYRGDSSLLLSVEPLAPEDHAVPPQATNVSLGDFRAHLRHTFSIPTGHSGLLGMFLCHDASHDGRCAGKPPLSPSEVVVEDTRLQAEGKPVPPDRVYLLYVIQFLAGHRARILADASAYDRDPSDLQYALSGGQSAEMGVDRAVLLLRWLRPVPAEIVSGTVMVTLAESDRKLCANRGRK